MGAVNPTAPRRRRKLPEIRKVNITAYAYAVIAIAYALSELTSAEGKLILCHSLVAYLRRRAQEIERHQRAKRNAS
jgi:hypothetical protein